MIENNSQMLARIVMTITVGMFLFASSTTRYVRAFTTLTSTSRNHGRNGYRTFSSPHVKHPFGINTSSSIRSSISDQEEDVDTESSAIEESPSSIRRYVLIHKNKQSMAFRNGSPMVYSGSVKKTIQMGIDEDEDADDSIISMGSLVAVVVDSEATKSRGGGGRGNNRNRRGGRGGRGRGKEKETKIDYNHYVVDKLDGDGCAFEYDRDGEFQQKIEDISVIEGSLAKGKLIGFGLFNPVSMYRAFIICHQSNYPALFKEVNSIFKSADGSDREKTENVIELVMKTKINDAIRSRMFMDLPSQSTDSYRLINGEGDGLAGLVVDILGGKVAVIMASAGWVEIYKDIIMKLLAEVLESHTGLQGLDLVWRNTPMRLRQDGYELPEIDTENIEIDPRAADVVILTENKIKYNAYPYDLSSQKTGFYCDQRENRFNLALQCKDKNVLDLCCYTGGFALNAVIHGGATSCVGVDSSQDAIDAASANSDLNDVEPGKIEFVKADIAKYMTAANDENKTYDIIILDPPKLAPTVGALERASRKYHSLNRDAMKLINPKEGGLLMTCTCSGAMTQKNGGQYFLETVKGAALAAGRRLTLLRTSGAAPCHVQDPASYPANAYLTAALFYVRDRKSVV